MAEEGLYRVKVERNLEMRTRDGVVLRADVYRPDAGGRFPTLVVRIPYDRTWESAWTEQAYFPQRGYVTVLQDTRGRFASAGEFYPFIHEAQDGYDTIEWAAALPWSNGKVGTVGQSYMGLVQYFAAPERPPHLAAMCPVSGPVNHFENFSWRHGVLELGWLVVYFLTLARDTLRRKGLYEAQWPALGQYLSRPLFLSWVKADAYRHLPLRDWGERLKDGAPYFADILSHPKYGPYWMATDMRRRLADVSVPMLHVSSWYDFVQSDTLRMFTGLRQQAMTEEARRAQKLVMGPWGHLMPFSVPTTGGAGEIDFGPEAAIELHALQARWFDYHLKGLDNGVMDEPPVRLFVMGDNRWRDEREWPLARTRYTQLFLSGGGRANTLNGDGRLSYEGPGEEPPDNFIYDPENPVPSMGGTTLGLRDGVYDQRRIESRPDVLVYTGEVLQAELELTGPVTLKLFAASSALDTDFTAKLVDVRPDGYAHNLVDGIVRARFRESLEYPSLLKPGAVYEYTIDLWATSHVFKPGHRLRLEVSSSNFPRYDRNQNTGHELGVDSELKPAEQTIFHDRRYPSHLILPVIPR